MAMHIALPEYVIAYKNTAESYYEGTRREGVGCSPINSGMFNAILDRGDVKTLMAGHDHINDFCALYKGVYLVYTQCSGYNTYNMTEKAGWDEKDWMQGATIVEMQADGSLSFRQKFNKDYL